MAWISVVGGALLLATKAVVFLAAPDWFLLANIVFALGALGTKVVLLLRRRRIRGMQKNDAFAAERSAYRSAGVAVITFSVCYLATLIPSGVGVHAFDGQELPMAILIAILAFTELVLATVAAAAGRKDTEPIASAIRRINLATAFVLIALAQSALMAAVGSGASVSGGIGFGVLAAIVGAGMIVRARRLSPGTGTAEASTSPAHKLTGSSQSATTLTEARDRWSATSYRGRQARPHSPRRRPPMT